MTEDNTKEINGVARYAIWISLSSLIVILDQLTKWGIVKWVPLYDKFPVNPFINITHQQNAGAAFSFLADASGWQRWFFVILAVTISSVIGVWLWRIRTEGPVILAAGLALVLGGAIGNVIDRILHGYVIDFIQVLIFGWPFPSFNVADSAITLGAVFLIIDAIFFSGKAQKKADANA